MTANDRIELKNGVKIYPFSSADELIEYVDREKGILVATNAEKILLATDQTKQIINDNVGYCDGEGAVRALKRHGLKQVTRIAGCDLWLKIVEKKHPQGASFYLVGTTEEIIQETVEKLKKDYPGINILNYRNGFLKNEEERRDLIEDIAQKKPDCVFVAMGSPRQELLMAEMQKCHKAIYQGLGGSFNVFTGHTARAPKWWQNHGLEFAYRLLFEKTRRGRYKNYVRFFLKLYTGQV